MYHVDKLVCVCAKLKELLASIFSLLFLNVKYNYLH